MQRTFAKITIKISREILELLVQSEQHYYTLYFNPFRPYMHNYAQKL